jgi:hypothetical protein
MARLVSTVFEKYVRYGFESHLEDPNIRDRRPGAPRRTNGLTCLNSTDGKIRVFVAKELFAPLLRDDVSDAEKLGLQWFAANILMHETIVSLLITEF